MPSPQFSTLLGHVSEAGHQGTVSSTDIDLPFLKHHNRVSPLVPRDLTIFHCYSISARDCLSSSMLHQLFVSFVFCFSGRLRVHGIQFVDVKEFCIEVSNQMHVADNMALCSPADLGMPRSPALDAQYICICRQDSHHCSSARTQDASSQNHYSSCEPTCSFQKSEPAFFPLVIRAIPPSPVFTRSCHQIAPTFVSSFQDFACSTKDFISMLVSL